MITRNGRPGGNNATGPDEDFEEFLASIIARCLPETAERKQNRSKRRDQEILRAALRVFAEQGISRARIGDIASEAGMPVSSIYEYYPSKEDLAYAVPIQHLARFYTEYAETVVEKKSAYDRLRYYLWLAADFARRNPEWARTLYLEIWPSVLVSESNVRHGIDDYVRVILHLLERGAAEGEWPVQQNPYETAAILNGSVNQVLITWLLYRRPRDLMKSISSVIDRTMGLLEAPAAQSERPRGRTRRLRATVEKQIG